MQYMPADNVTGTVVSQRKNMDWVQKKNDEIDEMLLLILVSVGVSFDSGVVTMTGTRSQSEQENNTSKAIDDSWWRSCYLIPRSCMENKHLCFILS